MNNMYSIVQSVTDIKPQDLIIVENVSVLFVSNKIIYSLEIIYLIFINILFSPNFVLGERCVLKMDHHCPWMNTCIGYKNHGNFTLFLLTAVCGSTQASILLIMSVIDFLNFVSLKNSVSHTTLYIFSIVCIVKMSRFVLLMINKHVVLIQCITTYLSVSDTRDDIH